MVLEREATVATQQSSTNSGVIHAGIYYRPGSLKARLCIEGARDMYALCEERGVKHERRGKVIVALSPGELGALDELERRGRENQVPGLRRLTGEELYEIEPHCRGVASLHSPATGVVDFAAVARVLAEDLRKVGVRVFTGCGVQSVAPSSRQLALEHDQGRTEASFAVFCAGTAAARLAVAAGADPDPRIVPFRGAYLYLRQERSHMVRSLIYPVPDPSLPFLGVHFSRHIDGRVSLGPTALLSPRDLRSTLAWPGTWRMVRHQRRAPASRRSGTP